VLHRARTCRSTGKSLPCAALHCFLLRTAHAQPYVRRSQRGVHIVSQQCWDDCLHPVVRFTHQAVKFDNLETMLKHGTPWVMTSLKVVAACACAATHAMCSHKAP
jgi:hypothetical protein